MPAAVITRDDAERIRRNLEAHGRRVPDGLQPKPTKPEPPAPPEGDAPDAGGRSQTAGAGAAAPAPAGASSPAAGKGRHGKQKRRAARPARPRRGKSLGSRVARYAAHPSSLAGDGGGLLLALWAYPLILSVLQHGVKGPGIWLRSKFLNNTVNGGQLPDTLGKTLTPKIQPIYPAGSGGAGIPEKVA